MLEASLLLGVVGIGDPRIEHQINGSLGGVLTVDHDGSLLAGCLFPVELAVIIAIAIVAELADLSFTAPVIQEFH